MIFVSIISTLHVSARIGHLQVLIELYLFMRIYLNLNSVNQLIFVMVKCGVLFEVRTEFLNII
jgi:hypothetical protein